MHTETMLRELFGYHEWATLALIDHCATLPPHVLHQPRPGTTGSVYEILAHLVAVEAWMLRQYPLTFDSPPRPERASLEDLATFVRAHAVAWQRILGEVDRDFDMPATDGIPAITAAASMLALQTIHHGEVHRTEIRAAASELGHPVPGRDTTDVWAYWQSLGRWPG